MCVMAGYPTGDQIFIGSIVLIETKENQRTGNFTRGTVDSILTRSKFHPHGIKVRLDDGNIGRVKDVLVDVRVSATSKEMNDSK